MSDWIRKAADPAPAAEPAQEPAKDKAPEQQPLEHLDKQRTPPPANPTGMPDQKPMPLSELLKLLEAASKALLDAGMDLEKGSANVQKISALPGVAESERKILEQAGKIAEKIAQVQAAAKACVSEIASFKSSIASSAPAARGSKGWWHKK